MTDLDRRGSAGPRSAPEPDDAGIPEVEIIDLPAGWPGRRHVRRIRGIRRRDAQPAADGGPALAGRRRAPDRVRGPRPDLQGRGPRGRRPAGSRPRRRRRRDDRDRRGVRQRQVDPAEHPRRARHAVRRAGRRRGPRPGQMGRRERTRYRRRVVGMIWQQTARNLLPYLTARENVELPMTLDGRAERRERARLLLELVGLGERLDHRPGAPVRRRAAAGRDRRRPRERAGRPASPTSRPASSTRRPRHEIFGLLRRVERGARDDDRDRHPRPARVGAGPAHGRDPRRPDLDRDGPPRRS